MNGQAGVVATFEQFASDWNQRHPNNPIGVGDLSLYGGAATSRGIRVALLSTCHDLFHPNKHLSSWVDLSVSEY